MIAGFDLEPDTDENGMLFDDLIEAIDTPLLDLLGDLTGDDYEGEDQTYTLNEENR